MKMMMKCLLYAKYKAAIENYRSFKSGGDTGVKYKWNWNVFFAGERGGGSALLGWCTLAPVLVQGCHRHHSSLIIKTSWSPSPSSLQSSSPSSPAVRHLSVTGPVSLPTKPGGNHQNHINTFHHQTGTRSPPLYIIIIVIIVTNITIIITLTIHSFPRDAWEYFLARSGFADPCLRNRRCCRCSCLAWSSSSWSWWSSS